MRRVEDDLGGVSGAGGEGEGQGGTHLQSMGDLCSGHAELLLCHGVRSHPEDADAAGACPRGKGVRGGEGVRVEEEDGPEGEAGEEGEVRGGGDGAAVEGVAVGGERGGDAQVLWRRHHPVYR